MDSEDVRRKSESTPLPQFLVIIVGVVIACLTCFQIARFYFVEIPIKRVQIRDARIEREALRQRMDSVERSIAEIDAIKIKVDTLYRLRQSRISYTRLFKRLARAMHFAEGVRLNRIDIVPDPSADGSRVLKLTYRLDDAAPEDRQIHTDNVVKLLVSYLQIEPHPLYSQPAGGRYFAPTITNIGNGFVVSVQFDNGRAPQLFTYEEEDEFRKTLKEEDDAFDAMLSEAAR